MAMAPNRTFVNRSQVEVQIVRYSFFAAALLRRCPRLVGRIHSRYARILNIQTPDGQLLTLQGPGALQAPCAASLAEEIETCAPHLAPGDLVAQAYDAPVAMRLVTANATAWDGRLRPLANLTTAANLRDTADQLARWLTQHTRAQGIAPVLAALNGVPVRSPLHRRFCNALTPMLAGSNVSADSVEDMAAQVIGLGEGLTPSGDDLLVGFLAVLHLTGHLPTRLHHPAWLDSLVANTTDLSAAFLRAALKGHFSEPMARLMQALYSSKSCDWQARAADLAGVGHSSGVDAMVGITVANRLLAAVGTTCQIKSLN